MRRVNTHGLDVGARDSEWDRALARVRAVAANRPSKPFGFDMGARVKDWKKPFITEVIPRLGVWIERRNCPLDIADLLDLLDYVSHCWELHALRDVARHGAVVELLHFQTGNLLAHFTVFALDVFHRVLSVADETLGYIAAHGRDGFDPEGFTVDELDAIANSLPPAPGVTLERMEKRWDEMATALIKQAATLDRIDANTRPQRTPRGGYNVTQEEAARLLARTVRTVKNWEAGKNTPEGYSRETRRTLETFTAWASSWAARQESKLNTKKAMRYADEHGYTFGGRRGNEGETDDE